MLWSLAASALLMGLVGSPHCVAMCGAACLGLGQAGTSRLLAFQLGRVLGYGALGALAAASMQGLGWLTIQSAALRPVWSLLHVAATLLGLVLLVQARQPVWLELWGKRVWQWTHQRVAMRGPAAPLLLGMAWALLPCGLLYSALLVAAMANGTVQGATVMAAFALGTSLGMTALPWLWLRLRAQGAAANPDRGASGDWAVRLAGALLAGSSAWALWMGLVHNTAPWCATP